jgi:hypothetical protein
MWVRAFSGRRGVLDGRRLWLPGLVLVDVGLVYYLYTLLMDKSVYYFSEPEYIPFTLLGLFVAGLVIVRRLRPLYVAHLVCFGVLVGLFGYWGFYGR